MIMKENEIQRFLATNDYSGNYGKALSNERQFVW